MSPTDRHLHIISFDVPFPADYGGVIDVYYKIKALHQAGIKIHLHCFEYGRAQSKELEKLTEEVHYYPRKTSRTLLFNTLPYIVLTRQSETLKNRLLEDNHPIWMEGLHSTFLLNDPEFRTRKMYVRTHNVEHDYYENLARVEKNIFKRYYFYNEAGKLKKYQPLLKKASAVAAISPADTAYLRSVTEQVDYLPAFHPIDEVKINSGKGDYALYHGNLSVGENNEAALYLVREVFVGLPFRLLIVGSKPSEELKKAVSESQNVELYSNLSPDKIYQLISDAQCNVLPTFQATGIKLKLLAVLFRGRHCLVNSPMVKDTGLESLCTIADTADAMKAALRTIMMETDFSSASLELRKKVLLENFSNAANADKVMKLIFSE